MSSRMSLIWCGCHWFVLWLNCRWSVGFFARQRLAVDLSYKSQWIDATWRTLRSVAADCGPPSSEGPRRAFRRHNVDEREDVWRYWYCRPCGTAEGHGHTAWAGRHHPLPIHHKVWFVISYLFLPHYSVLLSCSHELWCNLQQLKLEVNHCRISVMCIFCYSVSCIHWITSECLVSGMAC